jgi:hypothetical protein
MLHRPDLEIKTLLKGLESVKESPAGVFHATISPAAAFELIMPLATGRSTPRSVNTRFDATFWVSRVSSHATASLENAR